MRPYTFSIWIYKTYVSKLKIIFRRYTIKVIRRVSDYKVACRYCKSILGFKMSDIKSSYSNGGGYITCPVCSNKVQVLAPEFGGGCSMETDVKPIYEDCKDLEVGEDNG